MSDRDDIQIISGNSFTVTLPRPPIDLMRYYRAGDHIVLIFKRVPWYRRLSRWLKNRAPRTTGKGDYLLYVPLPSKPGVKTKWEND